MEIFVMALGTVSLLIHFLFYVFIIGVMVWFLYEFFGFFIKMIGCGFLIIMILMFLGVALLL